MAGPAPLERPVSTAAMYALFPDAREGEAGIQELNSALRLRITGEAEHHGPFRPLSHLSPVRAWMSSGHGCDPDEMLALLRRIDWAHPVTVVYRTGRDSRWSWVTLGLNTPLLGED